ncbi:MAG: MotA/TolQ/ExbB proton channel family protein [Methanophagales archaeon]|nr:MotA/TolQ/ExbB proton channel family protein [Methanophagales archaeon]MCW3138750.1 MotA/TolQ/ExbB proton channel family protein [Methanophagales archaeon]MCW7074125.1 MotA/TolQ/ExbB proton channel family protein [Methanophagales archaeon]
MDATSGIIGAMFMISNSLLYPVIIILLGLVAWSLISVGQLISEYASRNRDIAKLKVGCRDAKKYMQMQDYKKAAEVLRSSGSNDFLRSFLNDLTESLKENKFAVEAEKLLQDYELRIAKELEKARLVVKLGPMFGLMGTLIPLGPALMGLTAGNIQQLATNLVVAFSTTVLGLLSGGIAYTISLVKKRWYTQDLSDMEYVVEVLK